MAKGPDGIELSSIHPPLKSWKDKTHGDKDNRLCISKWLLAYKRATNILITLKSKKLFSGLLGLGKRPWEVADDSPQEVVEKQKRYFNYDDEVECQPGSLVQFEGFHSELYRLADDKQYILLHLFTLANLIIIQRKGNTLPTKKIQYCDGTKVMMLDISMARFGKEQDLLELQWCDTTPYYIDFLISLRSDTKDYANPAWLKHWNDHFLFFHNLTDFSLIFNAILAMDIKLRIDYYNSNKGFKFSQPYYASELASAKE
ncbi:uncharacterized protein ARMOST_04624 [Armillaria ostoyae]|uniref:Uncharacterized protein n=1 Tax=Armillaria ostoyae TaxID=47428 RepID=A0A284QXV2_ARMOS|nr:uncharacterized protein ARMOST_04624 [Armillaria ostoyae]